MSYIEKGRIMNNKAFNKTLFRVCAILLFILLNKEINAQPSTLITEVYYDTVGTDTDEEFIEIYNPNSFPVNISNYKVGDHQEKGTGTSEGMYKFLPGTVIPPYGTITIALKATGFKALFGKNPDFETTSDTNPDVPNMIKYGSWSTGSIFLNNAGDEILLLTELDFPIDVVTYEAGSYTGVTSHPGVAVGHSIERGTPTQDTDNCEVDFVDRYPPTPTTLRNIIVSPTSGTVGSFVTITGQGFFATEGIVIDFGTTITVATTTTDASGSFSTIFTATPQPDWGTITVSATGLTSEAKVTTEFNLISLPLLKFDKQVTFSGSATPGATLTYTLYYENIGSGTATNIVLTDAIPDGTTYITDSASAVGTISYSHDGGVSYDTLQSEPVTHIRWELSNPLPPGGYGSVNFEVRVKEN